MPKFKLQLVTFILLLLANVYIFVHKQEGWLYSPILSAKNLYVFSDDVYINQLSKVNDTLEIHFQNLPTNPTAHWQVLIDKKNVYRTPDSRLRFPTKANEHIYSCELKDGITSKFSFEIDAGFYGSDTYAQHNNTDVIEDIINITDSNIPIRANIKYTKSDFVYSPSDFQNTKAIENLLFANDQINRTDSTHKKIKDIVKFLKVNLSDSYGIPSDKMEYAEPVVKYYLAASGKDSVWCTSITDIYLDMATVAGISTRKVGFARRFDGFNVGGHAFAESFLPETNEWVIVDLSTNMILAHNAQGKYLSVAELYQRAKYQNTENLSTFVFTNDTIIDTVFNIETQGYYFLNSQRTELRYYFSDVYQDIKSIKGKLLKYLGIKNHFATYADSTYRIDNRLHYLKILLFLVTVASGLYLFYSLWTIIFNKKNNHVWNSRNNSLK
jgi:hypothetical protein